MKRIFFIFIFAFILCLLVFAVNTISINQQNADSYEIANKEVTNSKKQLRIACIVPQDDNFMTSLQLGMIDAANEYDCKLYMENTRGKIDSEIDMINNYIAQGIDGICIHPTTTDISMMQLEKARKRGVAAIISGMGVYHGDDIPYIQSDQWELGSQTGAVCRKYIEKNLKGKANIAIINYNSQFPEQSSKRTEGFKSEISKLKGAHIVVEQEAWISDAAALKVQNIIQSYPEINIIWCANEGATVGAATAVKNNWKMDKISVFGTDFSEQILNMLMSKDNILQSVAIQQPYDIGYNSIKELINIINSNNSNIKLVYPILSLSRENMDQIRNYYNEYRKVYDVKKNRSKY